MSPPLSVLMPGKIKAILVSILGTLAALLMSSCPARGVEELAREELFSLSIGKMDNQIDLFQIEGTRYGDKTRIAMRDGLFYIANGNSQKVMGFSSYGDLIFLLYNPDTNPPPVSFAESSETDVAATKQAVAYPFRRLGELAVDSSKQLYVEDMVAEERQVRDRELKVLLDRVILRFDRRGNLLDFIGQEGVGGTPFPYVESIWVTERDELVVICRTPQFWQVFWYSKEGSLRYEVRIDQEHLPLLDDGRKVIPSVGKLVPDMTGDALELLLYYYAGAADDPTAEQEGAPAYAARIYELDLRTGRYERYVEVPQDETRKERIGAQEVEIPAPSYELLGTSEGGQFFLLRREDANLFQLLILESGGRELARRYVVMEDSELYYKQVGLSASGILYALLGEEYEAKIVWWRSDRLVREGSDEDR
ncbi:MAG: hypothetical protein JW820_06190 [Spirochaetales bacterium]|nr:hypothetical protein [Spirochaetales bacterium]